MYTLETKHYNWHILLKSTANTCTYINKSYFLKENGSEQNTMLKKHMKIVVNFYEVCKKIHLDSFFLLEIKISIKVILFLKI